MSVALNRAQLESRLSAASQSVKDMKGHLRRAEAKLDAALGDPGADNRELRTLQADISEWKVSLRQQKLLLARLVKLQPEVEKNEQSSIAELETEYPRYVASARTMESDFRKAEALFQSAAIKIANALAFKHECGVQFGELRKLSFLASKPAPANLHSSISADRLLTISRPLEALIIGSTAGQYDLEIARQLRDACLGGEPAAVSSPEETSAVAPPNRSEDAQVRRDAARVLELLDQSGELSNQQLESFISISGQRLDAAVKFLERSNTVEITTERRVAADRKQRLQKIIRPVRVEK